MSVKQQINKIRSSRGYQNQIVHIEDIPAKNPEYKTIELKPLINYGLDKAGINNLYKHQVEAIENIRNGKNIVLSTGTASGKTLSYLIPVFEHLTDNNDATVIYVSPLNALVNDQVKKFQNFRDETGLDIDINRFIGSIPDEEKKSAKNNSRIIFTNPEMLHMSLLQWKHQWFRVLSNLKYIILDESHYYRGVLGSNMANLLRRLERVCNYYGSNPQYICCTATIGNPEEHAHCLTGKDVTVIDSDGSSNGPQKFVFWNPPLFINKKGFNVRKASFYESVRLFSTFVQDGYQSIIFTRSRQKAERMALSAKKELETRDSSEKVCSYRGGYHKDDRENIEKQLSEGTLRGVISTNALELGIDIGGLDVCVLDGYPGTVMNTKQQAGRAGRGDNESAVFMVAGPDALDQYYMRNPDKFFRKNIEKAVINVSNPYIQEGHILCAAKEIPLREKDEMYFGPKFHSIVQSLDNQKMVTEKEPKSSLIPQPHMDVSIRNISKHGYTIVLVSGNKRKTLEKDMESSQAFREGFEGSIYLSQGIPYIVTEMNHEKGEIYVQETRADYYTKPLIDSEISVKEIYENSSLNTSNDITIGYGSVEVEEQVTGYKKFQQFSEEELGEYSLDMPRTTLETESLWMELPERFKELVNNCDLDFDGGIHAVEHGMIAMYPIHLLADRNDVGGLSKSNHSDIGDKSGIFIYDGHNGGVGYAENGYHKLIEMLDVTLNAIENCPCNDGCPSCIQSPKCGNNNSPLDKHAAIMILREMLAKPRYTPPKKSKSGTKPLDKFGNSKLISADEWIKKGRVFGKEKKHKNACECFDNALQLEPDNANALYDKAKACFHLRMYEQSSECINKVLEMGYNTANLRKLKGINLVNLGKYQAALDEFNKALKLEPDNPKIQKLKSDTEKQLSG
ncbi:DEAD/DEAH box helicase domain protein [Methanohalobium evestigatum Z-7303]|uniref:DEAD/DEAH box helicase domain protein n=1 Tax=Methanohalobium evestigatum (strain ATCC BAA-1072 / DSM 3721 / NBRC 107634 / OCM 161 / Z-7303) TaxID=644295 RepID=D7E971_METEZ|nr:DEAD/DEAH box helicase [Methanohalobium evestigatum]ADI74019.1 DEAD/DEAH box helicase domain protein [Methanohalobium evestigatum Z-7303]